MKKAGKLNLIMVVGALCVASAAQVEARGPNEPSAATQPETQQTTDSSATCDKTVKMNRCSQLIGTTVENPQGAKLGKIEDVVVDFDTGRVSYCVLGVKHGPLGSTKYLAMPLAAIRPSANRSTLILSANKETIAQAQGFDRNNWPPVNNPAWGAQPFWETAPSSTPSPTTAPQKPGIAPSSHDLPRIQQQ